MTGGYRYLINVKTLTGTIGPGADPSPSHDDVEVIETSPSGQHVKITKYGWFPAAELRTSIIEELERKY